MIKLQAPSQLLSTSIDLPPSKSLANRLLLLQALNGDALSEFESNAADDIAVFTAAIQVSRTTTAATIDVGAAGTAMRFLCAYFSQTPGTWRLQGTERMHQRPIAPLVEALKQLGADITYDNTPGYPPLTITGKALQSHEITIDASISSQFISALLLIAPFLPKGLTLNLKGEQVSWSYIQMTLQLLQEAGLKTEVTKAQISIFHAQQKLRLPQSVEADWSAASYYYAVCALAPGSKITLKGLRKNSLQGDSVLPQLYEVIGVRTEFGDNEIHLSSNTHTCPSFEYDFINCPDLAQTLAVTCFGLGIEAQLSGLQTLAIKETNRLQALKTELEKFGAELTISSSTLSLKKRTAPLPQNAVVATYHDHRMAMSFAPLALKMQHLYIANEEVVTKSYPLFWKHLLQLGFNVNLQPQ